MELFTTNDVYQIMDTALIEQDYHILDIETKRNVVTECFTNYFIYKLVQLSDKQVDNLDKLTLVELFSLIENNIPEEKRMDILSHPIHYLLSLIHCLQGFEIIWEIDNNVNEAIIVVNQEDRFDKFVTSLHPNMSKSFDVAYQYFMKHLNVAPSSMHYNLTKENLDK